MKLKFLLIALFIATLGFAQNKATVSGVVTDKEMNNETLPFASITVKGTTIGTNTDENGKYNLEIKPGNYVLVFGFVGYKNIEVSVALKPNEKRTINQALGADSVLLEDVLIEATVNREKESALLAEQQKAVVMTQSIGAQELSRKGVSDAASAVTKVTGISKQEGSSGIFVRGLGDRYNSTLLNGLPLPSNEPVNKNIALDLFSTDVIQSVGINKTYTPDLYGDMGGANINIASKEHTGATKMDIEVGSGLNNKAFNTDFRIADNVKKSGFYTTKTPTSVNEYQFQNKWVPGTEGKPVNINFGASGGTSFNVGENGKISAFATASYANGYRYKNGSQKVVGITNDNIIQDYYNVDKFEFGTKTTAMANVTYKINSNHKIKANSVFVNSSKSTVSEYDFLDENARNSFTRQTLTEQNKLFVNQLLGDHKLSDRLSAEWGASYSIVNADMPDRITNNLIQGNDGNFIYNSASQTSNSRYYQFLKETEKAGKAVFNYKVLKGADDSYKGKISVGYNGRSKSRDFEATQFNFRINGNDIAVTKNTIDDFLNPDNQAIENGILNTFNIGTARNKSLKPFTYNADLTVHSGFINFEHNPTDKITYTVGVRAEKVLQEMEWETNISLPNVNFDDAKIDKFYILPAATMKYKLSDTQNLRLAASKSYTLPQFIEKAPFRYQDVTESMVGNPFLKPSDNYNFDIKWEMFPKNEELFSVTGFGKYISDPISKVRQNSALNDFTFINAGDYAYVVGAEFEVRKDLWSVDSPKGKRALSGGFNLTYMYSQQKLDSEKVNKDTNETISVNFNESKEALQGASPLLINADLSYRMENATFKPTVSIVANYFHDRIYSLGNYGAGNIVEKGYTVLNFISSAKIGDKLNISFNVKNLLDSKIERVQENKESDIKTYSYRAGLDFSLGLKYDIF